MNEQYVNLLLYLAGPAIVALVGAVVRLWNNQAALRLYISENYVKQTALMPLQQDTKEMKALIYEIAVKVGVPINRL